MPAETAYIEYGALAFSSVGSQPHPERSVRYERDEMQVLTKCTHAITLKGIILPDPTLTDSYAIMDSLTTRRALIEALSSGLDPEDKALVFKDSDNARVSWQYGGTSPLGSSPHAVWYPTIRGVKLANKRYPKGTDVEHASLESYELEFECEVDEECPVGGAMSCSWRETPSYTNGVITQVAFAGRVRVCAGDSCEAAVEELLEILRDRAADLLEDSGTPPILTKTITHSSDCAGNEGNLCEFSVTFGYGDPNGTHAERLEATATLRLRENRADLSVNVRYTYKPANRSVVINEALRLVGVDIDDWLPGGSQAAIQTSHTLDYDEVNHTVTAKAEYVGHWKYGSDHLEISESVSISRATPRVNVATHAWLDTDTDPPLCTLQVGGLGPVRIQISGSITSLTAYKEVAPRFTVNYFGGPVPVDSQTAEPQQLTTDVHGDLTDKGLWVCRYSQTWLHADPSTLPTPISVLALLGGIGTAVTRIVPEAS